MLEEKTYKLPDGRRCKVTNQAIRKMYTYRQYSSDSNEAGGILIGRILLESADIVIDDVTEPMPTDKRRRLRFTRRPTGHQEYLHKKWAESDGLYFYLGEWHTHPERVPQPSRIDVAGWNRITNRKHESPLLIFIIVGTREMGLWGVNRLETKEIMKGEEWI